jgi:hypothetical protein
MDDRTFAAFGVSDAYTIAMKHLSHTMNTYYSLRSILLVAKMDISSTKLCLDTFIHIADKYSSVFFLGSI